jgi:O-glycosyl hydrolase
MTNAALPSSRADVPSYLMNYGGSAIADFAASDWQEAQELASLAEQILEDPVALAVLSDRVYALLAQEIRLQQERRPAYRRS